MGHASPTEEVTMPRGYPVEFRAEAVQLYRRSGRSLREIATESSL